MEKISATLNTILNTAILQLTAVSPASSRLEAELLLCHVLNRPRSYLLTWPSQKLTVAQIETYSVLIQRRIQGEPIAYILGEWSFYTINLYINKDVLIPRPETELLVELALTMGDEYYQRTNLLPMVIDIGTGSGAIAAAIGHQRLTWQIYATDLSLSALSVANINFQRLGLSIPTYGGDWYEALPLTLKFNLILSNPPYLAENDPHLLQGDLVQEPKTALVSGHDGLDAIRKLCSGALDWLQPDGAILLEHGYNQGKSVRTLLHNIGMKQVQTWNDLAGHERVTGGMN